MRRVPTHRRRALPTRTRSLTLSRECAIRKDGKVCSCSTLIYQRGPYVRMYVGAGWASGLESGRGPRPPDAPSRRARRRSVLSDCAVTCVHIYQNNGNVFSCSTLIYQRAYVGTGWTAGLDKVLAARRAAATLASRSLVPCPPGRAPYSMYSTYLSHSTTRPK